MFCKRFVSYLQSKSNQKVSSNPMIGYLVLFYMMYSEFDWYFNTNQSSLYLDCNKYNLLSLYQQFTFIPTDLCYNLWTYKWKSECSNRTWVLDTSILTNFLNILNDATYFTFVTTDSDIVTFFKNCNYESMNPIKITCKYDK
jgi:hypothetical protein